MATIEFQGTEAGQPILDALQFLKSIEGERKPDLSQIPLAFINSKSWHRLIFKENNEIDRRAYTFCVLEQLRMALRRRDIFVCPSKRWRDPRVQLLQGEEWKSAKPPGSNPKYFGVGRGVTYYNFTSNQFTGFHNIRHLQK
jgi:hypothetical protein